jgi:hypothetical protein
MALLRPEENRRASRRRSLDEIPDVTGVKVQSEDVEVVNASSGGMLIKCSLRLPPGTASQLEIQRLDGTLRVRGKVVRCEVAAVTPGGLRYWVAIAFNERLAFMDDETPSGRLPQLADGSVATFMIEAGDSTDVDSGFGLNSW